MKKTTLIKLIILLLTLSTLSGCFWPRYDERRGEGEHHGEDHGNHR